MTDNAGNIPSRERTIYSGSAMRPTADDADKVSRVRYTVQYSADEFLRAVLTDLAADRESPPDIFRAVIGKPEIREIEVLTLDQTGVITFTAEIGDDRPATAGGPIVTDWSTLVGHEHISAVYASPNRGDTPEFDSALFVGSAKSCPACGCLPCETERIPLSPESCRAAETGVCAMMTPETANLPGDKRRDIRCRAVITKSRMTLALAPMYTVSVIYRGERFDKYAFPFGIMRVGGARVTGGSSASVRYVRRRTLPLIVATVAVLIACALLAAVGVWTKHVPLMIAGAACLPAVSLTGAFLIFRRLRAERERVTRHRDVILQAALCRKLRSSGLMREPKL